MLKLRAQDDSAYIDDIDHLSNRRLRTLDELTVDELGRASPSCVARSGSISVKTPDGNWQVHRLGELQGHFGHHRLLLWSLRVVSGG